MNLFPKVDLARHLGVGISADEQQKLTSALPHQASKYAEIMQQIQAAQLASQAGQNPLADPKFYEMRDENAMFTAVCLRLRMPLSALRKRFENVYLVRSGGKILFVYTHEGKIVSYVDDETMFPSDDLITTLRLCL